MRRVELAAELFAAWYERMLAGEAESADELCRTHPDIESLLREQLDALAVVDEALAPAVALSVPETIGPYAVERVLGHGGMGVVYRATATASAAGLDAGDTVALKVVHPHLLARPGFFKRFMREAEVGRRIEHPNVVRALDADALSVDGVHHHFLVMEYVEGQTLRDLLQELARVPEELCRHVAREICAALGAIHAAGAVHRDLKPENVLITSDHVVKVMDLGVARLSEDAARLSQTGVFVGSVHYAAPEQFGGGAEDVDGRADLHALGILLYELATGVHPFARDDYRASIRAILDERPRSLGELNPQLTPFFEELVLRLLAKDRENRFASAEELLVTLEQGEASAWWQGRAREVMTATGRPLRRIRIPRETSVHGRENEVARLRELYAAAKAGNGHVALLAGEAGIGKTRLVDELVARLVAEGEDVCFLFGSFPPGGAATASGAFSTAYREHLGGTSERAVARVLTETPLLVPAFSALLRGDAAPEGSEPLTRESLQTCFVHATWQLAREHVTIVLIDDLHFAPEDGRALFASLAHAVPGHRVLLIGTLRPGVPQEWIAGLTRLEQVSWTELSRLGPKDLIRLLEETFRSEYLAEELGARIALKSDGNPFFVFEIVQGLREGQFLTQRPDGTWASTRRVEDIRVPSSVLDLVSARVADLEAEERDLLDVAACCGFEFDPVLVGDVVGLPRVAVLRRLGQIERRHRLVRSAGRTYVFDHHQVQEALYASLAELLREDYHTALGESLERRTRAAECDPEAVDAQVAVSLSEHFLRGARREAALRYLPVACEHLTASFDFERCASLAERALGTPGLLVGRTRVEILLAISWPHLSLDALGRREDQARCSEEALTLAESLGDDALLVQAVCARSAVLGASGRTEEAKALAPRGVELAARTGDGDWECRAQQTLGRILMLEGRAGEAHDAFSRSLRIAEELGVPGGLAVAVGGLGELAVQERRFDEAEDLHRRAMELFRVAGNARGEASGAVCLGYVLNFLGRLDEAAELVARGVRMARSVGDRRAELTALQVLGNVRLSLGCSAEARECHERCLALARELGARDHEAFALGNLGICDDRERRHAAALELYDAQLTLCREFGIAAAVPVALTNVASSCLALGRLDDARAALEACLDVCEVAYDCRPEGYATYNLGLLEDGRGNAGQALAWMEQALEIRQRAGHLEGVADALIEMGDLCRRTGDLDRARELATEGVSMARRQNRVELGLVGLGVLACLPGGDVGAVLRALSKAGSGEDAMRAAFLAWTAGRDASYLRAARRMLDDLLARNPPEYHESMCTNVRVNREILVAWQEELGDGLDHDGEHDGDGDDGPDGTESVTRVG